MNPRRHIEKITKDYSVNERVRDSLEGAMRHVQRSFSRRGHLLMEFIQNAEDAGSHSMEVSLSSGQLVVTNNGRPFDNDDVDSICKIGKSSKSAERYIGYLGVGFKSTFLIADRVEIHSGTYRFAFDSKASATGAAWQIMPVWVTEVAPEI